MKKIEITNAFILDKPKVRHSELKDITAHGTEEMDASDGYHTFTELYDHRIALFIALCKDLAAQKELHIWRSKKHHDGSMFDGWFILGIHKKKGNQITYHLPINRWEETRFARTLLKAPKWDGHTPAQVIERLKNL